jgi:hypothetical protein
MILFPDGHQLVGSDRQHLKSALTGPILFAVMLAVPGLVGREQVVTGVGDEFGPAGPVALAVMLAIAALISRKQQACTGE